MWGVMFNMLRYIEGMYSPCSVVVCVILLFASIEPRKLSEECEIHFFASIEPRKLSEECEKHFFASIEPRKLSEECAKIVKKKLN
jgi:hypothetical protein